MKNPIYSAFNTKKLTIILLVIISIQLISTVIFPIYGSKSLIGLLINYNNYSNDNPKILTSNKQIEIIEVENFQQAIKAILLQDANFIDKMKFFFNIRKYFSSDSKNTFALPYSVTRNGYIKLNPNNKDRYCMISINKNNEQIHLLKEYGNLNDDQEFISFIKNHELAHCIEMHEKDIFFEAGDNFKTMESEHIAEAYASIEHIKNNGNLKVLEQVSNLRKLSEITQKPYYYNLSKVPMNAYENKEFFSDNSYNDAINISRMTLPSEKDFNNWKSTLHRFNFERILYLLSQRKLPDNTYISEYEKQYIELYQKYPKYSKISKLMVK